MYHQQKDLIDDFIDNARQYLKTRHEYGKMLAVEKGSKALSAAMTSLMLFIIFICFFVFISVAVAFLISEYYGKTSIGFGIVGLFYLFVGVVLYLGRERFLKTPLMNLIIRSIFQGESNDED